MQLPAPVGFHYQSAYPLSFNGYHSAVNHGFPLGAVPPAVSGPAGPGPAGPGFPTPVGADPLSYPDVQMVRNLGRAVEARMDVEDVDVQVGSQLSAIFV